MYLEHFVLTLVLGLLLGLLLAFGVLDAIVLVRLGGLRRQAYATVDDLASARSQMDRLARWLYVAGGAFGAAFFIGWLTLELL